MSRQNFDFSLHTVEKVSYEVNIEAETYEEALSIAKRAVESINAETEAKLYAVGPIVARRTVSVSEPQSLYRIH